MSMLHSIKAVLTYPPVSFPRSLSSSLGREISAIRFCTQPRTDTAHKMDKTQKPSEETAHGDVMSHSFGEGYATRSDEEGFGGIYGGNQSTPKTDQTDKFVHENHPAYDKTQGSEVKEKEKARHQANANA
ncbi:plant/MUD21-2 protein [Spatholobus suberectus]|nr:plant/MUD21-2 protein [Spatholobus suberectus]